MMTHVWIRTMSRSTFFHDLLTTIGERGRGFLTPAGEQGKSAATMARLCRQLLSSRGEASGVSISRVLHAGFAAAGEEDKLEFFRTLERDFGPDPRRVLAAAEAYVTDQSPEAQALLATAAEPPRHELFRRLNLAPKGTASLVEMRRQLIRHLGAEPCLSVVDADFKHLFASWFNRGFLVLRPIDWTTPAYILEKIIDYEAVHEIHGWDELRQRLEPPDRRCAAFFHPSLADDPLIFVQLALTMEMPDSVQALLNGQREIVDASQATTAVFYSISNCQDGLRGISFGNFLIKQVVEDLKRDLSGLKTFVTLSPLPGFARWISRRENAEDGAAELVADTNWVDSAQAESARKLLMPLAAEYLIEVKNSEGKPMDPVARFHLGNGARLERINWLGDRSDKGLAQSAGITVNYLYHLRHIESNHESYVKEGRVTASRVIQSSRQRATDKLKKK